MLLNSKYFLDTNKKFKKFENQKIIFFGNSQVNLGIDSNLFEEITKCQALNYSSNGEPLYFSLKKIENTISENPNLLAILNIGPLNFYKDHLYNLNHPNTFLTFFSKNAPFLNSKDVFYWFKKHPKEVISGIILFIFKNPIFIEKNEKFDPNLDIALDNFNRDKKKIMKKSKLNILHEDFEIKYLIKMLRKYPKNIFLINIPIHKSIEEFYINNENSDYNDFSCYLKNNNINFKKFIINQNDKSLFKDLTHLSKKGSINLTHELSNFLNEKENYTCN